MIDSTLASPVHVVDTVFLHDTTVVRETIALPVARSGFLGTPVSWDVAASLIVALIAGALAAWLAHMFSIRRLHRDARMAAYLRLASDLEAYGDCIRQIGTFFTLTVGLHLKHDVDMQTELETRQQRGELLDSSPQLQAIKWSVDMNRDRWKKLKPQLDEYREAMDAAAVKFFVEYDHDAPMFAGLLEAKKELSRQMFKLAARLTALSDAVFANWYASEPYPERNKIGDLRAQIKEFGRLTFQVGFWIGDMLRMLQNKALTDFGRTRPDGPRKVAEPDILILLPEGLMKAGDVGLVDPSLKAVVEKLHEKGERALWEDPEVLQS